MSVDLLFMRKPPVMIFGPFIMIWESHKNNAGNVKLKYFANRVKVPKIAHNKHQI